MKLKSIESPQFHLMIVDTFVDLHIYYITMLSATYTIELIRNIFERFAANLAISSHYSLQIGFVPTLLSWKMMIFHLLVH